MTADAILPYPALKELKRRALRALGITMPTQAQLDALDGVIDAALAAEAAQA